MKTATYSHMKKIKFSSRKDLNKGYSIILHNGTVVYTEEPWTFIVEESSIKKLDENGIHYTLPESVLEFAD